MTPGVLMSGPPLLHRNRVSERYHMPAGRIQHVLLKFSRTQKGAGVDWHTNLNRATAAPPCRKSTHRTCSLASNIIPVQTAGAVNTLYPFRS